MNDAPPVSSNTGKQSQFEALIDARTVVDWRKFFIQLIAAFAALLTLAASTIALTNPFGNLPNTIFKQHAIAQGNQRFQYPAIARSGSFDSVLVGTSTSGILRPSRFNEVLGGKFANLAMDSARAWEQVQIAKLFRSHAGQEASLIIGLDAVWCDLDADKVRITERGFPDWMYDDNPWNDLPEMLNATSLEYGLKRLAAAFGLKKARVDEDGFKPFLPDETAYDLQKVRHGMGPWPREAYTLPYRPPQIAFDRPEPPALTWLDELLALGWKRVALVFMPVHVSAQPRPGTKAAQSEQSCKAHIAEIANKHATPVVDFRITSPITIDEANYWDSLHYREPVGKEVAAHIAKALRTLAADPSGRWSIISAPTAKPWP